jgi:serine/threonine protein kinase
MQHYLAREMVMQPVYLTKGVDYWALGVILYNLLTGELPFVVCALLVLAHYHRRAVH